MRAVRAASVLEVTRTAADGRGLPRGADVLGAVAGWIPSGPGTGAHGMEVQVETDRIVHAGGMAVAALTCADVDVTTLDADAARALTAAFDQICRTLDHPLQVLVRVRPWLAAAGLRAHAPTAAADRTSGLAERLGAAEQAFEVELAIRGGAMRRTIHLLPTAPERPVADLDRAVDRIGALLEAAGVATTRLGGDELSALITEGWGGPEGPRTHGDDPLRQPTWREEPERAICGEVALRGVRLRRLPGVAVTPGWLRPLLTADVPCDVALHLHPVGVTEALRRLQRRLTLLRADQLLEFDGGRVGDARVEAGAEAAVELRDRLARNLGRPLLLSITAVAREPVGSPRPGAAHALRSALEATMAEAEATHFEHLSAAVSAWPLGRDLARVRKLVDSTAAATCLPFVESIVDDPGGYLIGHAAAGATPVRIAPFDRARHANANIAVLAASGRGKSYALNGLVLAAAARGIGSILLDPEGEYQPIVQALGGDYLQLRPGCGAALNILDAAPAGDVGGAERCAELSGAVVALATVLCGGQLDDVERAIVDGAALRALETAAGTGSSAVLGDCIAGLDDAPRVATVLRRFTHGPLGDLFNRPTSVRLDATVVGISLRDLREELVPAATLIVAEWLWALVRRDRRQRHIVVDEVGLLAGHAPLRTLLAQLARRCRKYGAGLVIATQNAGDLLATPEGRVMATNPAIVLLGGHRGTETTLMQHAYALTDAQRHWLEAAGRGDFLLLAGSRRLPVHIALADLHHDLVTGAAADREQSDPQIRADRSSPRP